MYTEVFLSENVGYDIYFIHRALTDKLAVNNFRMNGTLYIMQV